MMSDTRATQGRADAIDAPTARIITFNYLRSTARRRWRFWCATALLGLLVGLALSFALPKKYAAVSRLYLVEQPGTDASAAIGVDVSLLQTATVASKALASLHLTTPVASF